VDDGTDGDEAARAAAAEAVRRLGNALAGHEPPAELLARVTALADGLAAEAEAAPRRDKREEMATRGRMAEFRRTGVWPGPVPDGSAIDFDRSSFVGGPLSPFAMGATFWRQGDEAHGRAIVGPAYEGPPDRVHGGAIAALIDETMGSLLSVLGGVAFTGRLAVDYLAAAPVGVELRFRSWLVAQEGRRLTIACEGSAVGAVFARGEAIFVQQDPARLATL
jgi:acyl-coenzyme A thioesterase PaaI-like protein